MAQYYQVTSLEELHKLYPNLQLDNLEGISCMIQDDQVTQYTDGQGQQVIATIEQTGKPLSHNPCSSQQCTSQQPQLVVHQPTEFVIQQMDTSESQTTKVQYIQQNQQSSHTKNEIPVLHFNDPSVRSLINDKSNEESSLQQHLIKQEGSRCLPQVQSVMQQPLQIHQQIQAVDLAGNILVLQNQEHQDLLLNQSSNQKMISSSPEKQQQQPQHILIQRQQQQKFHSVISQKQMIQKNENSQQCIQHQILQSRSVMQNGGQKSQIIHQSSHQNTQPFQYFNQVAVIDSFSPPRITIEHQPSSSDSMTQPLIQPQMQQFKKKNVPQADLPTIIQQPQSLVSQKFEIPSSPPIGVNMPQNKKNFLQPDTEGTTAQVFIVQKVESPFLVKQNQTKIRFQSPQLNNEKLNDSTYQSLSIQNEPQIVEKINQESRQLMPSSPVRIPQIEVQQQMHIAGQISQLQPNKCSPEKNSNINQVKVGIGEKPLENKSAEQMNKLKVSSPLRTSNIKIKTVEQQTESTEISDGKEIGKEISTQQFQRFVNNPEPGFPSQVQPPIDIQNQIQMSNRGRGIRGPSPRGYQFVPRTRAIQIQTSQPRMYNVERGGGVCGRPKPPRGGGKTGRGGWASSGLDQRQMSGIVRAGMQQASQTPTSKNETNQGSNEIMEEGRMVVLLINGEKKIVKIPCSQNIFLGQILQQAGLSLTSPTPFMVEQVVDNNAEHLVLKTTSANSQQLSVNLKPSNITQVVSVPNSPGPPRSIIATIQQRPRGQSPFSPQASSVGIIKQRLHFNSPRLSSPTFSGSPTFTSTAVSESATTQSQNIQNSTMPLTSAKEESRFVPGFMAICPFCGISSLDFNKCIRCRRKLPENVKSQSIFSAKKKKEKGSGGSEKTEDFKFETEEKQSDSGGSEGKEKNCSLQGYDKRKLKPCLKKKKISDEPTEILILSSDEEDESKVKKPGVSTPTLPVLKKEPVYSNTVAEAEMINSLKESNLNEDLMKNEQPGSFTTLHCRTIRIGSYKVQPKERIFISTKGIRLVVNSLKNESATIIIPTADILKILIHFGKQIPVLFIYPLPKIGFFIRESLGMSNKMGPYYDPTSTQEETHKRITLLMEKITEDNKIAINKIFGQGKLEELSEKEANEILIRASPVEMLNVGGSKPTDTVRKIMVYPPPPEKGGITLNNQDYACLGEDQFLNDVIIDFYLKYLMLKVLSPADRNRTHVFSTFFYKRLTTKPKTLRKNDPENDPKLSPAEKRHMRVKGWTKQVNLFEKDFIIVPINEHSHWFLAIICFPGLTGPVRFSDNTPVEPEEITSKRNSQTVQIGNTTITHIIKADGNRISLEMDSGSDRDEAEGDQDDLHPSSDDEGSEQIEEEANTPNPQIPLVTPTSQPQTTVKDSRLKFVKRKSFKEPIKQPCILIFDSLAGASRVRVVATLRDYLKIEYKKKMGQERDFSKDTIKGAVPKVPQQNNFTDCGLYVLQYVESFFQNPLHDFKLPLKYLQDWFSEEVVSSKRQKLASLIRNLMEEQGIKVEEMGLPILTFTNGSNTGNEQTQMEDDEVEDEDELNEEEEETLRSGIQISEFENEDDEDLNVEEEDEMEDDEEEEEDDEDDDELDEDDEDEELEVGEIPRAWLTRTSSSCSEFESSVKRGRPVLFSSTPLVEYDPSDSDEDGQILPSNSILINENQATDVSEEREYCESDPSVVSESRKTVPLTEFQDFESQISCTTIDKNLDGKSNESDMVMSEGEEIVEEQCGGAADEEAFETSTTEETKVKTNSFNEYLVEKTNRFKEVLLKDNKAVQVSDILKKLVNDKNITISRKEDEFNSSFFRKHLDVKKFKVKDCDKNEEAEQATSPNSPPKSNLGAYKRSYQALKSVRIQKKTERNLELCSKRQKVDER